MINTFSKIKEKEIRYLRDWKLTLFVDRILSHLLRDLSHRLKFKKVIMKSIYLYIAPTIWLGVWKRIDRTTPNNQSNNCGNNTISESKNRWPSSERKENIINQLMKTMKTRRMSSQLTHRKSGTVIFTVSCINNIRGRIQKERDLILI